MSDDTYSVGELGAEPDEFWAWYTGDTSEPTYRIVRFTFDENDPDYKRVMKTGLTLEEAQEHCNREDTHGPGWFDGYMED